MSFYWHSILRTSCCLYIAFLPPFYYHFAVRLTLNTLFAQPSCPVLFVCQHHYLCVCLSCSVLSCLVLSCPILSYPVDWLPTCLTIYLSICLSVYLSIYLSTHNILLVLALRVLSCVRAWLLERLVAWLLGCLLGCLLPAGGGLSAQ